MGSNRFSILSFARTALVLLAGCGGGGPATPPPPPTADFGVSISPFSASTVLGNTTSAVTISISPQNGFSSPVTITLQGIPQGVDAIPRSSFSIDPGKSQTVSFSVSASATAGAFPVIVFGTSGALSHSVQLMLTMEPIVSVRTYQSGSVLYLESTANTDTARIGLEAQWGGSIVEVSLNRTNFVNMHDTGREIQAAQYDGNAQYQSGAFGWNPVKGVDEYNQGSPVLAQSGTSDSLYIKGQGYQWNPDDKGGGPGQPVSGDTYSETITTAESAHAFTFKVHFKVTHFGTDQHADVLQEFPAVYANLEYSRFARYGGTKPWTNDPISFTTMPILPNGSPPLYAPEQWAAFVNNSDLGLSVFIPGVAPYFLGFAAAGDPGPTGFGTNYFNALTIYSFGPNSVLEGDVYAVAGDYKHARQVIYDLHDHLPAVDIFTPLGTVDSPPPDSQLTGVVDVSGWTFDNVAVSKVDVYVDGGLAGTATYGGSRPDVANTFPNVAAAIGFTFSLDTRHYINGAHMIEVKALDSSGNLAVLPRVSVTVQN